MAVVFDYICVCFESEEQSLQVCGCWVACQKGTRSEENLSNTTIIGSLLLRLVLGTLVK